MIDLTPKTDLELKQQNERIQELTIQLVARLILLGIFYWLLKG